MSKRMIPSDEEIKRIYLDKVGNSIVVNVLMAIFKELIKWFYFAILYFTF